jgi:Tfp pilus assembly protein PilN
MIRVNLLKNRVSDQTTMQKGGDTETSADVRDTIFKIGFLLIFTLGLMVFEGQNIRKLNDEAARLQVRISELETQSAAKAAEADGVKDVENQARELEDKLKVLKLLSKLRLREVKTLDFMQSSIPEKVWLKTISFESEAGNVEEGRFSFVGNAVATEDLSEFVKRLEDSAYLTEVIVVKNQEVNATGKGGVVRDFTFTAEVEGGRKR